jgi:hypothetical protein
VLGRKELDKLNLQKQALLLESSLNRAALQADIRRLRSATTWVREAASVSREWTPWLTLLAPVAGFLVARRARRSASWFGRIVTAVKWVGPIYGLWKRWPHGRNEGNQEEQKPNRMPGIAHNAQL